MNFRRFLFAASCIASLCLASACTKKIDGSKEDKFFLSIGEISKSLSGERQEEFNNGLQMILFYAPDKADVFSQMDGKTADEVFEMIDQLKLKMAKPRLDTTRREKYDTSLSEVLKTIPFEGGRKQLRADMEQYNLYPWNAKNVQTINDLNAFEIRKVIDDLRRNEDPTTASQPPQTQKK